MTLLAANAPGSCAAETRYKDTQEGFSFAIPAGFQRIVNAKTGTVGFVGKRENNFAPNINIVSEATGSFTLAQYVAGNKQFVTTRIPSARILSEKATTLGGLPAHSVHARFQMPGMPLIANHQILCVHNRRGYVLTFTATPATIAKYEPIFEKVRASFKWEK